MMSMRIAVAGASGRMGRMLIEAVLQAEDAHLAGALDVAGAPGLGRDAGEFTGRETGVLVSSDLDQALRDAQCLIDFTRPEGTLAHLRACEALGVGMVIGTTGLDEAGRETIRAASERIPIVFAPNMSVGVNVTLKLLEVAARYLAQGFDVEVMEMHHRHKVDAPSGTALRMGEVVAAALGRDLSECGVFARHGVNGERDPQAIGFGALRCGVVIGDHTVF
ncbi:MAG: 4-hydroxy-tetrahydrodipicolinate reductase, partial [Burkholderiales bacterium]